MTLRQPNDAGNNLSPTTHIPIPYGCFGLIALTFGALTTLAAASIAIGMELLKYR